MGVNKRKESTKTAQEFCAEGSRRRSIYTRAVGSGDLNDIKALSMRVFLFASQSSEAAKQQGPEDDLPQGLDPNLRIVFAAQLDLD